MYWASGVSI